MISHRTEVLPAYRIGHEATITTAVAQVAGRPWPRSASRPAPVAAAAPATPASPNSPMTALPSLNGGADRRNDSDVQSVLKHPNAKKPSAIRRRRTGSAAINDSTERSTPPYASSV